MAEATPLYQIRLAVRRELEDINPGDTVIVAASGGADSSALAAALLPECEAKSISVVPLIVDHGLQKNSADVAHEAKKELTKLGYEIIEIRKISVEITDGVEASARRARYAALNEVAKSHNAVAIFLGHTKDDQAETVLINLLRGAGAQGLGAMRPGMSRPLLALRRSDTHAVCAAAGSSVSSVSPPLASKRTVPLNAAWLLRLWPLKPVRCAAAAAGCSSCFLHCSMCALLAATTRSVVPR